MILGDPMLNFTAIDFETANNKSISACSAGYAIVKDGKIVDTGSSLLKPATGRDFQFTHIHGITYKQVSKAPSWQEFTNKLLNLQDYYGVLSAPFLAHNSSFDKRVWDSLWEHYRGVPPHSEFYCTLKLARTNLNLDSYKLPLVAKSLSLPSFSHHDAAADAIACAQIALAISQRTGKSSISQLWSSKTPKSSPTKRRATPKNSTPYHVPTHRFPMNRASLLFIFPPKTPNPRHPLYGSVVCLTGELENFSRNEITEILTAFGATVSSSVTKKTSLLVTNQQEPETVKHRKALSSQNTGQFLEIIDEKGLIQVLKYRP
jgi:DNA polymerase-3 subunit epsilon